MRQIMLANLAMLSRNNCGAYEDKGGRWVKYGVFSPGGSDLLGLKSVLVTPAMVGRRLAQFAAVEVKSGSGRATPQQGHFIETVLAAGGLAGLARSVEDARRILCP